MLLARSTATDHRHQQDHGDQDPQGGEQSAGGQQVPQATICRGDRSGRNLDLQTEVRRTHTTVRTQRVRAALLPQNSMFHCMFAGSNW
jgi:hypothetical protein